ARSRGSRARARPRASAPAGRGRRAPPCAPTPPRCRARSPGAVRSSRLRPPGDSTMGRGPMPRLAAAAALLAALAAGCGGATASGPASPAARRAVAERFAAAVLHGDAAAARALLPSSGDGALAALVRRAAAPWKGQRASLRLPARRSGDRWLVRYAGTRTQAGGAFERETGELVVVVDDAAAPAVRYFAFTRVRSRFGTHHDSQLLPSRR